ncbi:MAG TPA: hypothetical protein VEX88_00060 [Glaciibacter sp.]|nr:hypothetical protein [Glaciibacter sp.]
MRTTVITALALSALALTGCSSGEDSDSPPASENSAAAEKVAGWKALATGMNDFQTKFGNNNEKTNPAELPNDAAGTAKLLGFTPADGTKLESFAADVTIGTKTCMTGPNQTYMTTWIRDEGYTRTLGTGTCNFDGGDIVISPSKAVDNSLDESMVIASTRYAEAAGAAIDQYIEQHSEPPAVVDRKFLRAANLNMFTGSGVSAYETTPEGGYRFCVVTADGQFTTYQKPDAEKPSAVAATGTDRSCTFDQAAADANKKAAEPSDFSDGVFEQTITKGEDLAAKVPELGDDPFVKPLPGTRD